MPSTPTINLDLRIGGSSDPGWHNVQASNHQTYGYCYTGGDDGAGGLVATVGQGRDTAPLQLIADQRYQIDSCTFKDDPNSQLTWTGSSSRAGNIVDANTQVENAEYSLLVTDTGNGNCTIPCDPPIINQPA